MAATIKIKNSSTTGSVPSASNLVQGELAVNVTDLGLYTENASGTVVKLNAPSIDDKNTGATKYLTIDTSGNLGLGVTPSAWTTTWRALQLNNGVSLVSYKGGSEPIAALVSNTFSDGTWKYVNSQPAARYFQDQGVHKWDIAASGTAGNAITFTQAMTLDASGNFLVNTTTAREKITVNGSIAASGQLIPYSGSTSLGYIGNDSSISGGSGSNIGLRSEAAMLFATGGSTERARIDSSGNLLVGSSTANSSNSTTRVQVTYSSNTGPGLLIADSSIQNNSTFASFVAGTTKIGSITANGTTAVAYNTSSDYRLKNTIVPMTGALARVALLKPCTYKWNVDDSDGEGFIAHELAEVCPDAVSGEKDAVDENGNPVYQGIDTSFLVATLTAAIQELKAEFDAYKASHP